MNKKISIYELLGLIKDGKAPKRIKYDSLIWTLREQFNDYFDEEDYLFFKGFDDYEDARDFLVEEVEILEEVEDKEYEDIEEIPEHILNSVNRMTNNIAPQVLYNCNKINALIRNQKYILEQLEKFNK